MSNGGGGDPTCIEDRITDTLQHLSQSLHAGLRIRAGDLRND